MAQFSINFELFKSMLKEEWRLHQSFIGKFGSIIFPVFILVFTILLSFFGKIVLRNLSRDISIQLLHCMSLLYGGFVGALGGIGEQVMTRRLGQVSMLLQLPQQYPVSFKRLMGIFFIKDAVFYLGYTFIPLTVGFIISTPIIGAGAYEMFMGGITLFLTFMMAMASSFLISAAYNNNKRVGGVILLLISVLGSLVWPFDLIPLGELLPPLGYWFTYYEGSLILSVIYVIFFSILGISYVKEKYESMIHLYENCLLKEENRFIWFGKLSTLISKEWLELKRSGSLIPVVGGFFGLIIGLYSLISIFEVGMGIYLPFNVISYSGFVGFMGIMTYSMITGIEPNDYMNILPIRLEKVIKAKLVIYLMFSTLISLAYIFVIGLIRNEVSLIPLGFFTATSTAIYIAAVTAYLTGLWTNILFFDVKILGKFAAFVIPWLTVLEVAAFWISNSNASMVIMLVCISILILSKSLFYQVGEKWGNRAFTYIPNNND